MRTQTREPAQTTAGGAGGGGVAPPLRGVAENSSVYVLTFNSSQRQKWYHFTPVIKVALSPFCEKAPEEAEINDRSVIRTGQLARDPGEAAEEQPVSGTSEDAERTAHQGEGHELNRRMAPSLRRAAPTGSPPPPTASH